MKCSGYNTPAHEADRIKAHGLCEACYQHKYKAEHVAELAAYQREYRADPAYKEVFTLYMREYRKKK